MLDWLVGFGTVNLSDGLIKLKGHVPLIYVTDPAHFKGRIQRHAHECVMKGITIGAEYMKVVIGHRPEAKSVAGGRKKSYIIKLGDCTITKSGETFALRRASTN